jgi:serine/threonine protein kinase
MADFPEIPGYIISGQLGKGGVGKVYLAIQEKLDRKVAIKVLDSQILKSEDRAALFENEAKNTASLSHSNIIQIFDSGKHGNYHYIIMEYLEESLRERMKQYSQGMPPETSLEIINNILKGLDYAHLKGIYHRDIKPENIMFKHDSTPVLVDFVIANLFDTPDPLTKSGQSIGTAYYMSPEQCKAQKKIDSKSDTYSLGAVLFEMLTGKKPYDGDTLISIGLQHIKEPIPRLPQGLSQYQPLIDNMMAKAKRKRLSSGPEFQKLLDEIVHNQKIEPSATPIIKKYMDLLKEKTSPFLEGLRKRLGVSLKNMKEKLIPLLKKIREKSKPFTNFMINVKIPFWALLLVMVIVALIILISNPYPPNPPEIISRQSMISSFLTEFLNEMAGFYKNRLKVAQELYERGDLESSKKGQKLVKQLKEIAPTQDVNDLQKKINERVKQLEQKYNEKISETRKKLKKKDFPGARESLSEAIQIKSSPELDRLEQEINTAIENQETIKEDLNRIKDTQVYMAANSKNTIDAYLKYINEYPKGHHIKKAQWNIIKLKTANIKKNKKLVDQRDMLLIFNQFDFLESKSNKAGTFKSNCQKTWRNGVPVIIDHTTDLMWYNEKPLKKMDFKETTKWIESLNTNKYGGYDDWRLPVLEEVGALLRRNKNNDIRLMDPAVNTQKIWTNDRFSANSIWMVNLVSGKARMRKEDFKMQVRPVRSME